MTICPICTLSIWLWPCWSPCCNHIFTSWHQQLPCLT